MLNYFLKYIKSTFLSTKGIIATAVAFFSGIWAPAGIFIIGTVVLTSFAFVFGLIAALARRSKFIAANPDKEVPNNLKIKSNKMLKPLIKMFMYTSVLFCFSVISTIWLDPFSKTISSFLIPMFSMPIAIAEMTSITRNLHFVTGVDLTGKMLAFFEVTTKKIFSSTKQ